MSCPLGTDSGEVPTTYLSVEDFQAEEEEEEPGLSLVCSSGRGDHGFTHAQCVLHINISSGLGKRWILLI